jgi:hypothetical protein
LPFFPTTTSRTKASHTTRSDDNDDHHNRLVLSTNIHANITHVVKLISNVYRRAINNLN